MDCLGVPPRDRLEAEFSEYFQHPCVSGQDFRRQFLQSGIARDLDEMAHQDRADALSLPGIDDDKGHLGSPRLEDDIPAGSDDGLAVRSIRQRDAHRVAEKVLMMTGEREIREYLSSITRTRVPEIPLEEQ